MKPRLAPAQRGDTSLLDLFIMLIAVAVVAAVLLLPALAKTKQRSSRINCVNNMKQIGLAFRMWAQDNGDKMPAQVSTNDGGTMELVAGGLAYPHFSVISNELGTPKILVCPPDTNRTYATNFGAALRNANLSYFVATEADEARPDVWLSGDRNLTTNGVALQWGLFALPTNRVMGWTPQLHRVHGNLAFADGSVQQLSNTRLHESATNMLRSWLATTNAPFRLVIP